MTTTTKETVSPGSEEFPESTDIRDLTYAESVRETLGDLLQSDPRVFLMGEDIGIYGGAFGVTTGLLERFGTERIRDTPISEIAIIGAGVGAALSGLRPVVELQFSDFAACAMDQIVNQAAKIHFMLGGAAQVPLVIRAPAGSGTGAAAQHSQSLEAWFVHIPGLKVVMPATPADAKGLLGAAVADPNPVVFLEHKLLYKERGPVPRARPRSAAGANTSPSWRRPSWSVSPSPPPRSSPPRASRFPWSTRGR
jgi:acetoin:2,6-dichlorophenolindophenol oxidoreductase subunit beta